MDGLPGMQRGVKTATSESVKPMKKMVGPYAPENGERRMRTNAKFTWEHLIHAVLLGVLGCVGLLVVAVRLGVVMVCVGMECRGK